MAKAEDLFKFTMMTKKALDLAEAQREYQKLLKSGTDRDEAWKRAFYGIYSFWVPADIPEPGDPALMTATFDTMRRARSEFVALLKQLDADLEFLESAMRGKPVGAA